MELNSYRNPPDISQTRDTKQQLKVFSRVVPQPLTFMGSCPCSLQASTRVFSESAPVPRHCAPDLDGRTWMGPQTWPQVSGN